MDTSEIIAMARDIAFLSLLVIIVLIAFVLFLRIKSLFGTIKRTQQSSKELASVMKEQSSGRAVAAGAGIAFFGMVLLIIVLRRIVNWVRDEVLDEDE